MIQTLPSLLFHYELVELINEGGNSVVWSVKDKDNNLYACKIPFENLNSEGLPESSNEPLNSMIVDEAKSMSQLSKFPNTSPLLTFYGMYEYNKIPVIVEELFIGYPLNDFITDPDKRKILTPDKLLLLAKGIFEQLLYLHQRGLNHGDLHTGNVLYNPEGIPGRQVFLIDISSQIYEPDENPEITADVTNTTLDYWLKAISILDPQSLFQKKDVFEVGESLYRLMGYNETSWKNFIKNINIAQYSVNTQKLIHIINSAIDEDISKRPSVKILLNYINDY